MKLTQVPVDFNVWCVQANGSTIEGWALKLSTGGIFIVTSEPLVPGERLVVEFLLPGSLPAINIIGESVWCRSYNDEIGLVKSPHVAGIKFIDVPKRYRHILQDYIWGTYSSESSVAPEEFSN